MLPIASLRRVSPRILPILRQYSSASKEVVAPTSTELETNKSTQAVEEHVDAQELLAMQAPNRQGIWSRSQQPREKAMQGPRFEQMIVKDQPRPYSAMELIHQQPVRWRHERVVSCDGGGGPLGHPRIFINLDKPQINWCTYCGIPFANEHHKQHIESLPNNSYPLGPTGHAAEVSENQRVTSEPHGQR